MTAPPYECPTRTTGPDCRSITAFVNLTSSANEVSGCCTTDTVYPSFSRILATASHPEPSAKAPCTRTTFLMPVGGGAAATLRVVCSSRVTPSRVVMSATTALSFFMTILLSSLILDLVCLNVFICSVLSFGFVYFDFDNRLGLFEFSILQSLSFPSACNGPQSVTRESPLKGLAVVNKIFE